MRRKYRARKVRHPTKEREKGRPQEEMSDAGRQRSRQKEKEVFRKEEVLRVYGKLAFKLIGIGLILGIVFFWVFGITVMKGAGMYPAVRDGDVVFFNRLAGGYAAGELVVYEADGETCVGRIAAAGGDTVDFTEEGYVIVNENVQQEEFFYPVDREEVEVYLPCKVAEDSVFILCDCRTEGKDSRHCGTVKTKDISGKIFTLIRRRGF